MSDDELRDALGKLSTEWTAQSQKADQQGRQIGLGNIQQANYQRGLAEGLRRASMGLQKLLDVPKVTAPIQKPEPEDFANRNREAVLAVIIRSGLKIQELHKHSDNSYSLMLPLLQSVAYDEELARLAAMPNVVILAHGKLPNSTRAYIDFAFRKPLR